MTSGLCRTLTVLLVLAGGGVPPDVAADVIATGNTPHLSFTASLSPDVVARIEPSSTSPSDSITVGSMHGWMTYFGTSIARAW